jgi:hypothetical protein
LLLTYDIATLDFESDAACRRCRYVGVGVGFGQVDEPDPVPPLGQLLVGELDCNTGLAGSTDSRQRHQSMVRQN